MIQISTEKQKALREAIAELTEEHQEVMNWLIENYDAAVEICKAKTLTENESQKVIHHAMQKNDDYLLVLALLERIINAP